MVLTQWETLCGLFFAFFEKIVVPILTSGGAITICALQSGRGKYVGAAARPAEQHPVRKENL